MISVKHLTKCYGQFVAVDDLSFEITEGNVYGFLGRNGAGKSTTMNIMTGCLSSTSGEVTIGGYDIFEETNEAKKLIGYLPEQPPLYMNESAMEYLQFVGEAKGLRGTELAEQIQKVVNLTKIKEVVHKRIATLSKGYKQRVGIAQALLGNPQVIILDEPTVGLDPLQIIEIRDLIRELGKEHTVILSSHVLTEVQEICDQVLIIHKGKLIAYDKPEKLEKELLSANEITITVDLEKDKAEEVLSQVEGITDIQFTDSSSVYKNVQIKTDAKDVYEISRAIFFAFAIINQSIYEMNIKKVNLENIFIELTEENEELAMENIEEDAIEEVQMEDEMLERGGEEL